jgi:hypothetical protein
MAIEYKSTILIGDTEVKHSALKQAYAAIRNDITLRKTFGGMNEIERLVVSHKLLPEHIKNNAEKILEGKVHMLFGSDLSADRLKSALPKIFEAIKDYDLAFFDISAGKDNEVSKLVLEAADLVVVSAGQNVFMTDLFFDSGIPEVLKDKNVLYCLGLYDRNVAFTADKFASKYGIGKNKVGFVPYHSGYRNALNSFNAPDFILRASSTKKSLFEHNEYVYFADSVRHMGKLITKALSLDLEQEEN